MNCILPKGVDVPPTVYNMSHQKMWGKSQFSTIPFTSCSIAQYPFVHFLYISYNFDLKFLYREEIVSCSR